jgi:hypothetical protein
MVAEFYIISESFQENANLNKEEIERKIELLSQDFTKIREFKDTNKLFVHPNIYDVKFIEEVTISDLLNNDAIANQHLDRDVRLSLKKIIWESVETDYTTEDVKEVLLPEHNVDKCHGLIGFNTVNDVPIEQQIVYNLNGWFQFRRYYLGLYPVNQVFFIEECIKYFPNLFFHDRNKTTVGVILHNCTKKIVFHLTQLNDSFKESQQDNLNRTDVLIHFSSNCKLDAVASLEGSAARKSALTFKFENKDKIDEEVCCEPHMKLCHNDAYPGDKSYSNDRRIYFHEGKENIQNNKILIGHIGDHL